jgi:beta-glucosidase-like glycosyl hydrolase
VHGAVPALLLSSDTPTDERSADYLVALPSDPAETAWVDRLYEAMSLEQRIGQLLMIRAHSNRGEDHERQVCQAVEKYQVGGLCFFQGTAMRQAELTGQYQRLSPKVPLLIAMDAEWGLGMRLTHDTLSYPRALTLGAISGEDLIYQMGRDIGRQCRRLGVHVNFAPVLDVNNNPNNPVINDRSFGEDPQNVARKASAYVRGLQDERVLACGKHFPGHGDTDVDSHHDLPVIRHDRQRLDAIEISPFQALIDRGLGSIMIAHLSVPSLDNTLNRPTTLSRNVVEGILRSELKFNGLIFTDALEMKGVTKHFGSGRAEVEAFKAGNDVLLLPENVQASVDALSQTIREGVIPAQRLEDSVKRILQVKYRLGLNEGVHVEVDGLPEDLNRPESLELRRDLLRESLVLVRDDGNRLAIVRTPSETSGSSSGAASSVVVTLAIGATTVPEKVPADKTENAKDQTSIARQSNQESPVDQDTGGTSPQSVRALTSFQRAVSHLIKANHFNLPKDATRESWEELEARLADAKLIVVCFHDLSRSAKANFGISQRDIENVQRIGRSLPVAVVHFGNPYGLKHYDGLTTVVQAYDDSDDAQRLAAQALCGAIPFCGKLPITASPQAQYGAGLQP